MQPSPLVFCKSLWIAAVWQEDVGKKNQKTVRWENFSTLICLFYGTPVLLPLHHNSAFLQGKENLDVSSLSGLPSFTGLGFSVRSNYT